MGELIARLHTLICNIPTYLMVGFFSFFTLVHICNNSTIILAYTYIYRTVIDKITPYYIANVKTKLLEVNSQTWPQVRSYKLFIDHHGV